MMLCALLYIVLMKDSEWNETWPIRCPFCHGYIHLAIIGAFLRTTVEDVVVWGPHVNIENFNCLGKSSFQKAREGRADE